MNLSQLLEAQYAAGARYAAATAELHAALVWAVLMRHYKVQPSDMMTVLTSEHFSTYRKISAH